MLVAICDRTSRGTLQAEEHLHNTGEHDLTFHTCKGFLFFFLKGNLQKKTPLCVEFPPAYRGNISDFCRDNISAGRGKRETFTARFKSSGY